MKKDIVSFIFSLIPILSIYATGIPSISFADLFILFCGTLGLLKKGSYKPLFFTYVIYSLVVTITSVILGCNNLLLALRTIISFLMFFYFFSIVSYIGKINHVINYLLIVGNLCCAFLLFQYFVLLISGYVVPGVLSFLPLANSINTEEFLDNIVGRGRLSSFFTEPAHFCEFLVIILTLRLFHKKQDYKNIVIAIVYTVCIVISKSAMGFACILFLWGGWFVRISNIWNKHRLFFLIIVIIVIIGVIPFFTIIGETSIISRFTQISFTPEVSSNGYSSYIRVLRGYIPYIESNMIIKLFGGGIGYIYSFVFNNPNTNFLFYVDYNIDYLNSVQYILLYTGLVGFVIIGKYFSKLYFKTNEVGKMLLLVSLLQMFACAYLFSMNFIIVIYIVVNITKHDINNYSNL